MWWVVGCATVVALFVAQHLFSARGMRDGVATMLAWFVAIGVFVGLGQVLIQPEPPTPLGKVANEKCSDRVDELHPDSTSINRYESCPGYLTCVKKARLEGREANCSEWMRWPEKDQQQAIFDRYFETFHEEIVKEQRERSRRDRMCELVGCDYVPEPVEPPCNGFYYC